MERNWWWKAIAVFLLTLLSVAYLLPTAGSWGGFAVPKWISERIDAKLNLGLDLQGGIHLVYEVAVDKAVEDKRDRLASDIEDRLTETKKVKVTIERQGRDDIIVKFITPADIKVVDKDFMSDFQSNLDEISRDPAKGELRLRMDEDYVAEVQDYAVRQGVETIRNRVDQFGVAEPSILQKGRDIIIEMPMENFAKGEGEKYDEKKVKKEFERVKRQIGRTAQLEFKICDDENTFMTEVAGKIPADKKAEIKIKTSSFRKGKKGGVAGYTYLESSDRKVLQKFLDSLPSLGLKLPKDREIVMGEAFGKDDKGNDTPDKIWQTYFLISRAGLTGEYITDARVNFNERTSRPEVGLTFDHRGAELFGNISGDNVGKRMAIVLDGKVNSAPVLQERIGGGRAVITLGGMRGATEVQNEARDLAAVLRSGALPAPLRKTFERQVGPTLGQDAVRKGKYAFSIGALFVILFILYYYRGAGLVCDLALILNFLFIMAILAGFGATLTLPGIAGLVLTIGMAVDANVIIYERIREEVALGKTPRASVEAGYSRAFWTIFDAQLTTAIAGFVLLQFGSGPIRGFAVTLLIGILCSIFTGVVVTRLMLDLVVHKFKVKKLSI
jgi:preprotein translocase subunit SecD